MSASSPRARCDVCDSGISLEAEPFGFFHALVAGAAIPVTGDGADPPLLEEEPAVWPSCA
jgi:hypothetical protein